MTGIRIRVDALEHRYKTDDPVPTLQIPEIEFAPGEFVSLIGPSGCGKSTLLLILAGLVSPSGGQVHFDDQAVVGRPFADMGVMFQSDLLLEWRTVLDNVLLQADIRGLRRDGLRSKAKELLEIAHLGGMEEAFPAELSGGMRQRVAICRSLLHDPKVLLMDEPFAALDALTREKMGNFLGSLGEVAARTVVFVTHSIPEAVFLSDRVLVMGSGPGRFIDDVRIDLPRPRSAKMQSLPEYVEAVAHLRSYFENDEE